MIVGQKKKRGSLQAELCYSKSSMIALKLDQNPWASIDNSLQLLLEALGVVIQMSSSTKLVMYT